MTKKIETYFGEPGQVTMSANAFLTRCKDKDPEIFVNFGSSALLMPGKLEGGIIEVTQNPTLTLQGFQALCITIVYEV